MNHTSHQLANHLKMFTSLVAITIVINLATPLRPPTSSLVFARPLASNMLKYIYDKMFESEKTTSATLSPSGFSALVAPATLMEELGNNEKAAVTTSALKTPSQKLSTSAILPDVVKSNGGDNKGRGGVYIWWCWWWKW